MKAFLLFVFFSSMGFSQNSVEVYVSELNYLINKDSTEIIVSHNSIPLKGLYKILEKKDKDSYSIINFINGKAEGISKTYNRNILVGTKEFKNGLLNGYSTMFDITGKTMMWKIYLVNGKKHGLAWWADRGNVYYINDKEVTKKEFDEYKKVNN